MHTWLRDFIRQDVGRIRLDASLREFSRWRIGGPADVLIEPGSVQQVQNLRKVFRKSNIPHVIIGDASNLLFDDAGIRGVVVKIGRALSRFTISEGVIDAEAGIFVPKLVRCAAQKGLCGLEHAIGIPGTLGGLIHMNGGSMHQGIGEHIERVTAVNREGELVEFSQEECSFSYRHSVFQDTDVLIVGARLRCSVGKAQSIRREMLAILRSRRAKFPVKQPNCGSVFLSDPSMHETVGPPGMIIEKCGLKGLRIGDAMVTHLHANFVVNLGNATSSDVLQIIRRVRESVYSQTGHRLMCEVRYVTPTCQVLSADAADGSCL